MNANVSCMSSGVVRYGQLQISTYHWKFRRNFQVGENKPLLIHIVTSFYFSFSDVFSFLNAPESIPSPVKRNINVKRPHQSNSNVSFLKNLLYDQKPNIPVVITPPKSSPQLKISNLKTGLRTLISVSFDILGLSKAEVNPIKVPKRSNVKKKNDVLNS